MLSFFLLSTSVIASFIFAGFETGFISWNPYKVEALAQQGSVTARLGLILQNNRAKVLTTVLVGNNIALVLMENSFNTLLGGIGLLLPTVVQSLLLTLFVVLFCELLPKSLYRIYSFRLTYGTIPFLSFFYFLVYPISLLFEFFSRLVAPQSAEEESRVGAIALEGVAQNMLPPLLPTLLEKSNSSEDFKDFCTRNLSSSTEDLSEDLLLFSDTISLREALSTSIQFEDRFFSFESESTVIYRSSDILLALF